MIRWPIPCGGIGSVEAPCWAAQPGNKIAAGATEFQEFEISAGALPSNVDELVLPIVQTYENGKVVNHEGSWLYGVHTRTLGMMFPATPKIGQRYRPEEVPKITQEDDEVMSVTDTVTVPAGTFQNCVRIKETLSDGAVEFKLYCPKVGIVREGSDDGVTDLASHR